MTDGKIIETAWFNLTGYPPIEMMASELKVIFEAIYDK